MLEITHLERSLGHTETIRALIRFIGVVRADVTWVIVPAESPALMASAFMCLAEGISTSRPACACARECTLRVAVTALDVVGSIRGSSGGCFRDVNSFKTKMGRNENWWRREGRTGHDGGAVGGAPITHDKAFESRSVLQVSPQSHGVLARPERPWERVSRAKMCTVGRFMPGL